METIERMLHCRILGNTLYLLHVLVTDFCKEVVLNEIIFLFSKKVKTLFKYMYRKRRRICVILCSPPGRPIPSVCYSYLASLSIKVSLKPPCQNSSFEHSNSSHKDSYNKVATLVLTNPINLLKRAANTI